MVYCRCEVKIMANQKKYNHPEAPENIDIKEEV
jgi:hypothetical protein